MKRVEKINGKRIDLKNKVLIFVGSQIGSVVIETNMTKAVCRRKRWAESVGDLVADDALAGKQSTRWRARKIKAKKSRLVQFFFFFFLC